MITIVRKFFKNVIKGTLSYIQFFFLSFFFDFIGKFSRVHFIFIQIMTVEIVSSDECNFCK